MAEVHEESDNMTLAIEEYERALVLRRAHLEPHSRLIAEVYSCMAFDFTMEKRNADALNAYKHAAQCVEKKIVFLQHTAETSQHKGKEDPQDTKSVRDEINELSAILEDLHEKVHFFVTWGNDTYIYTSHIHITIGLRLTA